MCHQHRRRTSKTRASLPLIARLSRDSLIDAEDEDNEEEARNVEENVETARERTSAPLLTGDGEFQLSKLRFVLRCFGDSPRLVRVAVTSRYCDEKRAGKRMGR